MSPAVPVYRPEETALGAPCYQVAELREDTVFEESTRAQLQQRLAVRVTARGSSEEERDELSAALKTSVLDVGLSGAIEAISTSVEFDTPTEGGTRTYSATYTIQALYYTDRS